VTWTRTAPNREWEILLSAARRAFSVSYLLTLAFLLQAHAAEHLHFLGRPHRRRRSGEWGEVGGALPGKTLCKRIAGSLGSRDYISEGRCGQTRGSWWGRGKH
jgi:hypothetical protein